MKAVVNVQQGRLPQTGPEKITVLAIEGSVLKGEREATDACSSQLLFVRHDASDAEECRRTGLVPHEASEPVSVNDEHTQS